MHKTKKRGQTERQMLSELTHDEEACELLHQHEQRSRLLLHCNQFVAMSIFKYLLKALFRLGYVVKQERDLRLG